MPAIRELARAGFDSVRWIGGYASGLLVELRLAIYCAICLYIYSLLPRDAFPGRYLDIFLWIALIQGVSSSRTGPAGSPQFRKLLGDIVEVILASLK